MTQPDISSDLGWLGEASAESAHVRRRHDLKFQQIDSDRWNVLDPISRQSYRVGVIEHWLLTRPDGRQSVTQLLARLRIELAGSKFSDEQFVGTLAAFRNNGLLQSTAGGQPTFQGSGFWQGWLGSFVVWQIRGVQPDRWLAMLAPCTGFLFCRSAVRCWLILALATLALVLLDFRRFSNQSLSLQWILHPATGGWLFAVFVITRGLHELGHALVCKRFGVRCPDIGVFVILGAPCVYCDVSESWQLPRRWQRAAVAAAGMYVEMIVATLAAWLWLATIPGAVNTLALQTMIVCSISTLVININPLMRFDGYYILADWLDEVNLRGKADTLAGQALRSWILGVRSEVRPERSARRRFLLGFSLGGWIYRAGLSVTIAGLLVAMYAAWNLPWVGRCLAAAILVCWWGVPAMKFIAELIRGARQQNRRWRLALATGLLAAVVVMLPLPNRNMASGWLQPSESQGVYVRSAARLSACGVRDGELVAAGQPLFQLHNYDLANRLTQYQQAQQIAAIRLESSQRRRDMHGQDIDVGHYMHQLDATTGWYRGVQQEIKALTLAAPRPGRLVAMTAPTPSEPTPMPSASRWQAGRVDGPAGAIQATTWCDPEQVGRFVPEGSLLASICSDCRIAVIPLDERQLSNVSAGTSVRLRMADQGLVIQDCVVKSVVQVEELASPWQAAALASLNASSAGLKTPAGVRFAAVIELPPAVDGLPGATVDAVFLGPPTTLAVLAIRWMHANLRLFAD